MVKSSMTRSPKVENLLTLILASIMNYNGSNATEVAKWATPSCIRPHPAMDNGKSNLLAVIPTLLQARLSTK